MAEGALQRLQKRRNQEPTDPAVQFPVCDTGIISLAELIGKGGICQRVDKPHEHFARIGGDVAIMQGDHVAILAGNRVAHAIPDIAPLAGLFRREPKRGEALLNSFEARAVVPQDRVLLRQTGEIIPGEAKLLFVCPVQTYDDVIDVIHLAKLIDDLAKRRSFEL